MRMLLCKCVNRESCGLDTGYAYIRQTESFTFSIKNSRAMIFFFCVLSLVFTIFGDFFFGGGGGGGGGGGRERS